MSASIPFGSAQLDVSKELHDHLVALGLAEPDTRALAHLGAFGRWPADAWMAGLRAAAAVFAGAPTTGAPDWGTLPDPWDALCPRLASANGSAGDELAAAIAGYDAGLQVALLSAISAAATDVLAAPAAPSAPAAQVPPPAPAPAAQVPPLTVIDPKLIRAIDRELKRKAPKNDCRKRAGALMLDWLRRHGRFIRTPQGATFYLYRDEHRVFRLDTGLWHAWLYCLTGCNPASPEFRYLTADCTTAALDQRALVCDVVRLSHWDTATQTLRVSRFDGAVYRLDGETIAEEANGDGPVLFEDAPFWAPYAPDFGNGGGDGSTLRWSADEFPNWDSQPREQGLLFRAWWLTTFFTELCPTRTILVLKGEKGSGKTTAVRVPLQFLFGSRMDVAGVPDEKKDFIAQASNAHVLALDNLDTFAPWLRDLLATLSTGKTDQVRELYTTADIRHISYRCWLAITSRTPDTLQRDDIVDRVLLLQVERMEGSDRKREQLLLEEVQQKRNRWWGDVLATLNRVVGELRRTGLPERGGLRVEDWAAVGSVVARASGEEELWERSLERVRSAQSAFLLEDDVVASGIETWLASPQHTSTLQPTRELYGQVRDALYGTNRPDSSWPTSVRKFGRRLAGIRRELAARLARDGVQMNWTEIGGTLHYKFIK